MGEIRQGYLHECHQNSAQDRTKKMTDPADIGHHQDIGGRYGPDGFSGQYLVVDGKQTAGDTSKKTGQ